MNDENLRRSLKDSELCRTESSVTQAYELSVIKSRLEENHALIQAVASETKKFSSKFDVYVD